MKRLPSAILSVLCCMALYACDNTLLKVYKIDVQQGNVLESEAVERIKLGMSKEQVHFVLGSPLIADSFHPDRWDYVYILKPGYAEVQRRQLTLIFDRNEIIEIIKHNVTAADDPQEQADTTEADADTDR